MTPATGPLGLDPVLLEILACPAADHGELRPGTPDDPDAAVLTCQSCGRRFPVHRRDPGPAALGGDGRARRRDGPRRDRRDARGRVSTVLDEALLEDTGRLLDADRAGLLRAAATAGAQVRATWAAAAEVGVGPQGVPRRAAAARAGPARPGRHRALRGPAGRGAARSDAARAPSSSPRWRRRGWARSTSSSSPTAAPTRTRPTRRWPRRSTARSGAAPTSCSPGPPTVPRPPRPRVARCRWCRASPGSTASPPRPTSRRPWPPPARSACSRSTARRWRTGWTTRPSAAVPATRRSSPRPRRSRCGSPSTPRCCGAPTRWRPPWRATARSSLAAHAGVVAHSGPARRAPPRCPRSPPGWTARGSADSIFADPFDDPVGEGPPPRLAVVTVREDLGTRRLAADAARRWPSADVLEVDDADLAGDTPGHDAVRAGVLGLRLDLAALYLGLATGVAGRAAATGWAGTTRPRGPASAPADPGPGTQPAPGPAPPTGAGTVITARREGETWNCSRGRCAPTRGARARTSRRCSARPSRRRTRRPSSGWGRTTDAPSRLVEQPGGRTLPRRPRRRPRAAPSGPTAPGAGRAGCRSCSRSSPPRSR